MYAWAYVERRSSGERKRERKWKKRGCEAVEKIENKRGGRRAETDRREVQSKNAEVNVNGMKVSERFGRPGRLYKHY